MNASRLPVLKYNAGRFGSFPARMQEKFKDTSRQDPVGPVTLH
ncbi:MAG: hypothetical protein ACTSWN_00275 [Promethearchaeota archaeon]